MTHRLGAVLAGILYLLAQASVVLHHAERFESCVECGEGTAGTALHCSGEDCSDSSHHHHHDHGHHPATCRTCSTDLAQEAALPSVVLVDPAVALPETDPSAPPGADSVLHRSIRGPPARA